MIWTNLIVFAKTFIHTFTSIALAPVFGWWVELRQLPFFYSGSVKECEGKTCCEARWRWRWRWSKCVSPLRHPPTLTLKPWRLITIYCCLLDSDQTIFRKEWCGGWVWWKRLIVLTDRFHCWQPVAWQWLFRRQLLPPFASAGKTLSNGGKRSTCWTAINICQRFTPVTWSSWFLRPSFSGPCYLSPVLWPRRNASPIFCATACVSSAGPCLVRWHVSRLAGRHMSTQLSTNEDSQLERTTEYVRLQQKLHSMCWLRGKWDHTA